MYQQNPVLAHYSGYTEAEIIPVFKLMVDYCYSDEPKHEHFHTKYASKKYMKGKH